MFGWLTEVQMHKQQTEELERGIEIEKQQQDSTSPLPSPPLTPQTINQPPHVQEVITNQPAQIQQVTTVEEVASPVQKHCQE